MGKTSVKLKKINAQVLKVIMLKQFVQVIGDLDEASSLIPAISEVTLLPSSAPLFIVPKTPLIDALTINPTRISQTLFTIPDFIVNLRPYSVPAASKSPSFSGPAHSAVFPLLSFKAIKPQTISLADDGDLDEASSLRPAISGVTLLPSASPRLIAPKTPYIDAHRVNPIRITPTLFTHSEFMVNLRPYSVPAFSRRPSISGPAQSAVFPLLPFKAMKPQTTSWVVELPKFDKKRKLAKGVLKHLQSGRRLPVSYQSPVFTPRPIRKWSRRVIRKAPIASNFGPRVTENILTKVGHAISTSCTDDKMECSRLADCDNYCEKCTN